MKVGAMNKQELEAAILRGLTQRELAKEFGRSHTSIRHWLEKFGLKTKTGSGKPSPPPNQVNYDKQCMTCDKFAYGRGNYCVTCSITIRRIRVKLAAVIYKGGKCEDCGWKGNVAGFDFHHMYDKKFGIGEKGCMPWNELQKEIDKCKLLCAICHRIKHSFAKSDIIQRIYLYDGGLNIGKPEDLFVADTNWYVKNR